MPPLPLPYIASHFHILHNLEFFPRFPQAAQAFSPLCPHTLYLISYKHGMSLESIHEVLVSLNVILVSLSEHPELNFVLSWLWEEDRTSTVPLCIQCLLRTLKCSRIQSLPISSSLAQSPCSSHWKQRKVFHHDFISYLVTYDAVRLTTSYITLLCMNHQAVW